MKRKLVLSLVALIVAIMGVRVLYAQEQAFVAVRKNTPGVTNLGAVGAIPFTGGALDTATGNLPGNAIVDVLAFGSRIAAVDAGGNLILLTSNTDGTFGFPQIIPLASIPTSMATDGGFIAITELGGLVETISGGFISGGTLSGRDNSDIADVADDGLDNDSIIPLLNTSGTPRSAQYGRFTNSASSSLVVLNSDGNIDAFFAVVDGSGLTRYSDAVNTLSSPTVGLILANREEALGVFVGNGGENADPAGGPGLTADTDEDLFVATTSGGGSVQEFATTQNTMDVTVTNGVDPVTGLPNQVLVAAQPTATFGTMAGAPAPGTPTFTVVLGSAPSAVAGGDLSGDGLVDIVAANSGNGSISTNLATTGGYNPQPVRTFIGGSPTGLQLGRNNSDATPDAVVTSATSTSILNGNPNGVFTPARTLSPAGAAAFASFTGAAGQDVILGLGTGLGVGFVSNAGTATINKVFTATSLVTSLNASPNNDLVLIEQAFGIVFVVLDVSADTAAAPRVTLLDLNDIFTTFETTPTAATAFRDAQNGGVNLGITDIGTPTNTTGFGQIIVALNTGTGVFSDFASFRQFVATTGATNILSGDFDNSGNSEQLIGDDLVFIDFNSNFAAIALNDGTNFFLNPNFRETGGFVPVAGRLGDVNDDDRLDFVVVNQGASPVISQTNQSIVSVLLGDGAGRLFPTGALLQVPNFGLSIVGGIADFGTNNLSRIVDFNTDGFPDFAVASTRGGIQNVGTVGPTASVTLLINRQDSPGNFTVSPPIALIDDTVTAGVATNLQLESGFGGPGLVSGRAGDPIATLGVPGGGANYVMAVGDYNADGSPDLVVSGTRLVSFDLDGDGLGDVAPLIGVPGAPAMANFRSAIYAFGNETANTVRVARPMRTVEYSGGSTLNPFVGGGDTFVSASSGDFANFRNFAPDVLHVSIAGNLWIDANVSSILNHAPLINLRKVDLPNSNIGVGRKVVITAGQGATINVGPRSSDVDGDPLRFFLRRTPTGEAPPSFVTINETTGVLTIAGGADVNRGPGTVDFRIAIEVTDAPATQPGSGPGARLPLTGREFFTLRVLPNAPPTIGAIANQTVEAGKIVTVNLSITDAPGQTFTASALCDRGNFVSVSGTTLTIAPQAGDVGTSTCTVTATDNFGLSSRTTFAVTVVAANLPPTLATIPAQTVKAGTVVAVNVSATDPNGNAGLLLSLTAAPTFVTISDNGNGTGTIRLAPLANETQGGLVTVQVRDPGGLTATTSFQVTVTRNVQINSVSRAKPNLFISGFGFGQSGATVSINGQNVSARIIGQSDSSITLKGSKKKLNLRSGPNQISVTSGGITSNTFVLNLLASDE